MKRVAFIIFAAGLVILETGCASSGKAALLSQKDPIALVSVVSNLNINWKGEEPVNPGNTGLLSRRPRREDPDIVVVSKMDEFIDTAGKLLRESFSNSAVINLADEETILNSRSYQEAQLNRHHLSRKMATPMGYRLVDHRDKNLPSALAREVGIQRSMFVEFNFTLDMATGFGKYGTCRANAEMMVLVLDARGKTIYRKILSAGSRPTIDVSDGKYSETGLLEILESVVTDVCLDFLDDLEYY